MDTLSLLLKAIHLKSVIYFEKNFHGNWGMEMVPSPYGQFHLVTRGRCLVTILDTQEQIELQTNDIILFPFGIRHALSENSRCQLIEGSEVYNAHTRGTPIFDDGPEKATLICGHYEFNKNYSHSFIQELPEYIIVKGNEKGAVEIRHIAFQIGVELLNNQPGSNALVHKLGEVLFILMIRIYSNSIKDSPKFLKALNDTRIAKALSAIHSNPESQWNLEALAKLCGLSRTSFVNIFFEAIGKTPIQYLTCVRMITAKELLLNTSLSLVDISEKVGYSSDAAFSRAFKKEYKLNPSELRNNPSLDINSKT